MTRKMNINIITEDIMMADTMNDHPLLTTLTYVCTQTTEQQNKHDSYVTRFSLAKTGHT